MRKFFVFFAVLLLSANAFAQHQFTVTGHIAGLPANTQLIFERMNYSFIKGVDTIVAAADGGFIFKDTTSTDILYRLRVTETINALIVADAKTEIIKIETDLNRLQNFDYTVEGSPRTQQIQNFVITANQKYQMVQSIGSELQNPSLPDSVRQMKQMQYNVYNSMAQQFVHQYLDTVSNPIIGAFGGLSFLDIRNAIPFTTKLEKRLLDTYKDNLLVRDFIMHAEEIKKEMQPPVAFPEGTEVPDIVLKDTTGKDIKLSDLRGKYVLIDFWASWCGPCRAENPNVATEYQKYKDKGFTVFSISLDNDKTKWINAIKKDKLAWPYHVSELKGWQSEICKPWKIGSIPSNFLIDKDGKVIGTNLRGEDLQNKLKEIFAD